MQYVSFPGLGDVRKGKVFMARRSRVSCLRHACTMPHACTPDPDPTPCTLHALHGVPQEWVERTNEPLVGAVVGRYMVVSSTRTIQHTIET